MKFKNLLKAFIFTFMGFVMTFAGTRSGEAQPTYRESIEFCCESSLLGGCDEEEARLFHFCMLHELGNDAVACRRATGLCSLERGCPSLGAICGIPDYGTNSCNEPPESSCTP